MLTWPEVLFCCQPRSQGYFSRASSDGELVRRQPAAWLLSTAGKIAIVNVWFVVDQNTMKSVLPLLS